MVQTGKIRIGRHERGHPGREIEQQGLRTRIAGVQQDQEITDFLGNFVGNDRQRRYHAQAEIDQERAGDDDAVDEIVEGIAHRDHQARAAMIVAVAM